MRHEYAAITFEMRDGAGTTASITVPAPRRFYLRWAMWIAARLWAWATE